MEQLVFYPNHNTTGVSDLGFCVLGTPSRHPAISFESYITHEILPGVPYRPLPLDPSPINEAMGWIAVYENGKFKRLWLEK